MSCVSACGTPKISGVAGQGEPGGTLPDGDTGDYLRSAGGLWVPSNYTLPLATTVNDLGEVLSVDAAGSTVFQPLFQRHILQAFGGLSMSPTTIWLHPWAILSAALASITLAGFLFPPISGRYRNMRVRQASLVVSADNITYTLVKNGVPTALSVTLNTATSAGTNLVDLVEAGPTDQMSLRATGATVLRTLRPVIQFDFEY